MIKRSKITQITLVLILAILFCQSCAVGALPTEPMTFKKETAANGLIVGSITFPNSKAKFNGYFIKISSTTADEKTAKQNTTEIHISPEQMTKMKHVGELDNGLTYLFAIERPEGPYEIPGIRLFKNSGIAALQRTIFSGQFSIPFDVKKGEITYVGNILFNEYAGANDTLIRYKNNYQRDINALKELQPGVAWSSALNNPDRKIEYK